MKQFKSFNKSNIGSGQKVKSLLAVENFVAEGRVMKNKYYITPGYDDIDLAPTWEVRKRLFWCFSLLQCEFDHKEKAAEMAVYLNQKEAKHK